MTRVILLVIFKIVDSRWSGPKTPSQLGFFMLKNENRLITEVGELCCGLWNPLKGIMMRYKKIVEWNVA